MPASNDVEGQAKSHGGGATWWCRLLAKAVGVISAIICFICGVLSVFTIHPECLAAGIIMIFIAFILLLCEAPVCCMVFEQTKVISDWFDRRNYWHKGLLYVVISVIPVALCFGVTTFFGCIAPFATGVIYGLMSLGRKADRDEMLTNAGSNNFTRFENESG